MKKNTKNTDMKVDTAKDTAIVQATESV
jgi:phage anti-repressor protein